MNQQRPLTLDATKDRAFPDPVVMMVRCEFLHREALLPAKSLGASPSVSDLVETEASESARAVNAVFALE